MNTNEDIKFLAEKWVKIKGFPKYEVSDHGRVRSWNHRLKSKKPIVLKLNITRKGYYHVMLTKEGDRFGKSVHRLVLIGFKGNPPTKKTPVRTQEW